MNQFLELLRRLSDAGVEFVVVGGTAAVLHGSATATYDLDVAMPFSKENCQRVLDAVSPLEPRLAHTPDRRPLTIGADDLSRFRNLYLSTKLGRLDLLGSVPPIESLEILFSGAEWMDVGGVKIRVISLAHLIVVKAALDRPKDRAVAVELRAIAAARARTNT